MATSRNALGRGLGALIPGSAPDAARERSEAPHEIPIEEIAVNPEQPRRIFDPVALEQLAASIRVHGVLQPVVVRRVGERFELIVGERRWRAARAAGLSRIPAVIAEVDAEDRLEIALIENIQRRDLNPIELAFAFRALADSGATQDEIGQRVSLDRSTIANHMRLLDLPVEMQGDVEAGRLGVGHAKALLQVRNPERRRSLRDRIVSEELSVRAVEDLARGPGAARTRRAVPDGSPEASPDPDLARALDGLRQRLQTRVRLLGDARRGRIEIAYFDEDDLDRIMDLLLGDHG